MYSPQLLDHFEHPRNAGDLGDPDARIRVENPACGDILELSAIVDNGRIREIRFRAKGCVPAIACGSLVTELTSGRTVAEAKAISKATIEREIGGVPEASGHAAQLAADALRALVERLAANA
jgi:nitrogen fixation protein NifU and related proteins